MKDLIKFALEMPAGDLQKYGTLFLSGPIPEKMSRGELIALQLVERASFGDLEAVKEIRHWIVEDPKAPAGGGDTYYTFLMNLAGAKPSDLPPEATKGLRQIAQVIEAKGTPSSNLLDDL